MKTIDEQVARVIDELVVLLLYEWADQAAAAESPQNPAYRFEHLSEAPIG